MAGFFLMMLLAVAQQPQKGDTRPIILAFGDSLTAGYGVTPGFGYPEQLQKKLDAIGYQYRVVNMGLSGDTTNGARARMNRALALNPTIVILELGGNDASNGLTPSQTEANLEKMILGFQSGGAKVVLASRSLPRVDDVVGKLAAKYRLTFIFNFLDGVAGNRSLTIADGVHPNADGYVIVTSTVLKALLPLLK
jgi:acyl-CoA thioesterase-1